MTNGARRSPKNLQWRRACAGVGGADLDDGISAPDGILRDRQNGQRGRARSICAPCRRCKGAHNWQNACMAYGAARALGLERRRDRSGDEELSGPCPPHAGGRRASAMSPSSMIPRPPMPMRRRRRSPPSTTSTGLPAALPRPAASRRCSRFFPRIAKAYLIGQAADEFAKTLGGKVPYRDVRHARSGGRRGGARCAAPTSARRGGAAVAGLRLLRPLSAILKFAAMPSCKPCRGLPGVAMTIEGDDHAARIVATAGLLAQLVVHRRPAADDRPCCC